MTGLALLLAASAMGVDYGWRPHEEGGVEYIIQIEPEVFASLQAGGDIVSEIHPDAGDVRRFRVRIGRGTLPREEAQTQPDDGPLPPAPPGDLTSSDETTPTRSASTGASPPLNQLAQGSGYGSPFGGYSRATNSTANSAGSTARTPSSPSPGSYGTTETSGRSYPGSSRSGYSDYTGATEDSTRASTSTANTGAVTSRTATGSNDSWNRGEVRTANNQQTVTASSNSTGATSSGTTASGQYASQPATTPSTGGQQSTSSSSNNTPGNTITSGQSQTNSQPAYGSGVIGAHRGARDYSATGDSNGLDGYSPAQGGTVTPISSASTPNTGQTSTNDPGRWNSAPAAQDQAIAPPPAYPQQASNQQPNNYGSATNTYANPGYNNFGSQQPPGTAPPLLAPPAATPGNYGYLPAGFPPYQGNGQPAAYGYGQAPGYYGMPALTPPVLTASATGASDTSAPKSRNRREEEEEEEDYRDRRSSTPIPANAASAPQENLASSEPWLAFTITIVLLFASIGGNIYLLWISQDFYWRYKELANDLRSFNSAAS